MTETSPIPEGYEGIIPHLVVPDAKAAIDFYSAAFDAVEVSRASAPGSSRMSTLPSSKRSRPAPR